VRNKKKYGEGLVESLPFKVKRDSGSISRMSTLWGEEEKHASSERPRILRRGTNASISQSDLGGRAQMKEVQISEEKQEERKMLGTVNVTDEELN